MNIRQISDFAGMGLSIMCAVHCLLLPILLITLPSLVSLGLDNEVYHYWMRKTYWILKVFGKNWFSLECSDFEKV